MSAPEIIGLHLADKHLKKIAKGGTVQLSHPQLHESIVNKHTVELHMLKNMYLKCYVHIEMVKVID